MWPALHRLEAIKFRAMDVHEAALDEVEEVWDRASRAMPAQQTIRTDADMLFCELRPDDAEALVHGFLLAGAIADPDGLWATGEVDPVAAASSVIRPGSIKDIPSPPVRP